MRSRYSFIPVLLAAIALFSGCNFINPPEEIPAYIEIPSVQLNTDTPSQGSASHKITDAWVTVQGNSLGAYELPATFPVLTKGEVQVLVKPGVKENGIAATRTPYPFYETYVTTVNLQEKQTTAIKPVVTYTNSTKFAWLENFEGTSPTVELGSSSQANYSITFNRDSAADGQSALLAVVSSSESYFEVQSKDIFQLPRGKAVWLEVNYMTDVPVEVGLYAISSGYVVQKYVAGMNPIGYWNKIYINLGTSVSEESYDYYFKVFFSAQKPSDITTGRILLDNIKVLYLE